MITMDELLSNQAKLNELDAPTQKNLNELLTKMNLIQRRRFNCRFLLWQWYHSSSGRKIGT